MKHPKPPKSAEAIPAILVDEVWTIHTSSGPPIGPMDRSQLDEMVRNGLVAAFDQLYRNGEYVCAAREMYSKFRVSLPAPVRFLICGPDMPPYQPAPQPSNGKRWALYGSAIAIGCLLFGCAMGLNPYPFSILWGVVMYAAGMFCLAGALFEWRWFFNNRNARGLRRWFGDHGARLAYIGIGCFMLVLAYGAFAKDAAMGVVARAMMKPIGSREEMNQGIYSTADRPKDTLVLSPIRRMESSRTGDFNRVALSAEGAGALLSGQDRPVHFWSTGAVSTLNLWDRTPEFLTRSLAVRSANGAWMAAVLCENQDAIRKFTIQIYDVQNPMRPTTFELADDPAGSEPYRGSITGVGVTGDGRRVAVMSDRLFQLWNLTDERVECRLDFEQSITALALSNDGTRLLVGDHEGTVQLWDLASRQRLFAERGIRRVQSLALSVDGALAAGHFEHQHRKTLRVWDVGDELLSERHSFSGFHDGEHLAFSNDGRLLAAGGSGDYIRVRDVSTGKDLVWLVGVPAISDVAFSPNATHLVASSRTRSCCLWELPSSISNASADDGDSDAQPESVQE